MNFKRLEFKCKCDDISIIYVNGHVSWPDSTSEFEIIDEKTKQIGLYRTWVDNVLPDSLIEERKLLKQRVDGFILGMQFLGNPKISKVDESLIYIAENGEEYTIKNDKDRWAWINLWWGFEN